jgi:hypothetical protein
MCVLASASEPGDGAAIVVLVDQPPRDRLVVGKAGGEREAGGAARRHADRLTQRDDRIEHGAGGVREGTQARERGPDARACGRGR